MANQQVPKAILQVSHVGHESYGRTIIFQFNFANAPPEIFSCRADLYPKILSGLNAAGGLADKVRNAQPGSLVELSTPLKMTSAVRTGQAKDGTVAFEFGTEWGFPIQLSMSRDLTERTIELLQAELDRMPPTDRAN
jgi:hypothetical protein